MNQLFKKVILLILISLFLSCNVSSKDSQKINKNYNSKQKKDEILQDSIINGSELTKEEIAKIFTPNTIKKIDVKFEIYKVYIYQDVLGKHYLIFTENVKEGYIADENKVVNKIKAIDVLSNDNFKIISTINDHINEYEKSLWFWTRYLSLEDFDQDGYIDPIVIYGSESIYGSEKFDEGRIMILIYYKGKKIGIRHQNSEYDDGRHTQIDKAYYFLPKKIKQQVFNKIKLLEERGHALFNSETIRNFEKAIK